MSQLDPIAFYWTIFLLKKVSFHKLSGLYNFLFEILVNKGHMIMIEMNETVIAMNTNSTKSDLVTRHNEKLRKIDLTFGTNVRLSVRAKVKRESYKSYYNVSIDRPGYIRELVEFKITLNNTNDKTSLVIHQNKHIFSGMKLFFYVI